MKIGLCKNGIKPDTNKKYVLFEVNGEIHNIMYRYTHRKGIEAGDIIFDGYPAKLKWKSLERFLELTQMSCLGSQERGESK